MSDNGIVRGIDSAWMKLGELMQLPSAKSQPSSVAAASDYGTVIDLPGGRSARVKLLEVKGEYDFNTQSSQYKSTLAVGNAKVHSRLHDVTTQRAVLAWPTHKHKQTRNQVLGTHLSFRWYACAGSNACPVCSCLSPRDTWRTRADA